MRLTSRWRRQTSHQRPLKPVTLLQLFGPAFLGLLVFLGLDGFDYIVTLLEAVQSPFAEQLPLVASYALRHGALYYALTKFVVS